MFISAKDEGMRQFIGMSCCILHPMAFRCTRDAVSTSPGDSKKGGRRGPYPMGIEIMRPLDASRKGGWLCWLYVKPVVNESKMHIRPNGVSISWLDNE